MTRQTLQLGMDEVWRVLELIDPVDVVAAALVEQTTVGNEVQQTCRFVTDVRTTDSVLVEDLRSGGCCRLPASVPRELRTAAVVALAARKLLVPGVVTAGVLGSGSAVQLLLAMMARHVPGGSFVAVYPAGEPDTVPVELAVLDLLDRAGIGLSVAEGADEAVFGANLLVIDDLGQADLRLSHVAPGALLINVSGQDLPDRLVRAVDWIYVDDMDLLDGNRHREFVRMHLDRPDVMVETIRRHEGWCRGRRRIDADLGQVLAGASAADRLADDILLVELLGARELDVVLACQLQQAAREHRIGTWSAE